MSYARSVIRNRGRLFAFVALTLGVWGCATPPARPPAPDESMNIVWPPPPDTARVKFIEVIRSNRDVEGRTQRNLKEILLGIDPDRLAVSIKKPSDVTTDSRGRVLVTDTERACVHVFDRNAHTATLYGTKGSGALSWPLGIDVDGEDNIYVADHRRKVVFKYGPDGVFKQTIGEFKNPTGIAVDKARRRLFVVDSKDHFVQVFDLSGNLLESIGGRGTTEGLFNFPVACAVDHEGTLYVVDSMNARVQVFDDRFEPVGSFGSLGMGFGQFNRPKGIAVDHRGIIYVTDGGLNNVQMFDQEFNILMFIGRFGREAGQFAIPGGIHVDERDNIYVTDYLNSRLQVMQFLGGNTDL